MEMHTTRQASLEGSDREDIDPGRRVEVLGDFSPSTDVVVDEGKAEVGHGRRAWMGASRRQNGCRGTVGNGSTTTGNVVVQSTGLMDVSA